MRFAWELGENAERCWRGGAIPTTLLLIACKAPLTIPAEGETFAKIAIVLLRTQEHGVEDTIRRCLVISADLAPVSPDGFKRLQKPMRVVRAVNAF